MTHIPIRVLVNEAGTHLSPLVAVVMGRKSSQTPSGKHTDRISDPRALLHSDPIDLTPCQQLCVVGLNQATRPVQSRMFQ